MTEDRLVAIRAALESRFNPDLLDVIDESHLHEGHVGARSGKGHYRVVIVSGAFSGLGRLQRHRAVFEALGEMMETDIHALTIQAASPEEI